MDWKGDSIIRLDHRFDPVFIGPLEKHDIWMVRIVVFLSTEWHAIDSNQTNNVLRDRMRSLPVRFRLWNR